MKKMYMIAGKARAGKDTISSYIKEIYENKNQKVCILQISRTLKYYAEKVLNWDLSEETKPREFLQATGDIVRKQDEAFFIKRLIEDANILFNFVDVIIVSDVRMPLEFEEVKKSFKDVVSIFVDRPNFENSLSSSEKKHKTETALDDFNDYKYIIRNDGDLEHLKEKVNELIREETK